MVRRCPNWECLFVNREKGQFFSVYVDVTKLAGKRQRINPTWKCSWNALTWQNQHHFLTMFIWVALKENVKSVRILSIITDVRSNQGFLPDYRKIAKNKSTEKFDTETTSSWSYDMEGHAKKCVERFCELTNETTRQLYEVATPRMDDHHFEEEENGSVGERSINCLLTNCSEMLILGMYWEAWSFNGLWRNLHDRLRNGPKHVTNDYLVWSYTFIIQMNLKQQCHVGNATQHCRLGLFQDSDFAGDLEVSKSNSAGTLCVFGSHTFVPISWMCKKQTSVSHSSTESEIISLDGGLRLDGILARVVGSDCFSPWKHNSEPW